MLRGPKLYPTVTYRWLDDIGVSRPTRLDYAQTMRLLQSRIERERPGVRFNEITPDDVSGFIDRREDGHPRADRSRRKYLSTIWQIFDWAADPEVGLEVAGNPAARLRARKDRRAPRDVRRKTWLSQDQAKALIASVRADPDPLGRRDAFIVTMFLYTGLRIAELVSIRWRDVDLAGGAHGVIHVVRKGGKLSQVPLNPASRRVLFAWRSEFTTGLGSDRIADLGLVPRIQSQPVGHPCRAGVPRESHIVWNRSVGQSIVRQVVRERAAAVGIRLAPHDLRRSYAGILRDNGAGLDEIRDALGHSQLATTEIYLRSRPELPPAVAGLDFG